MGTDPIVHAVDDDAPFLIALTRTLRSAGLNVLEHTRAEDFLRAVDPERSGCVVTDLRLVGMDGLALQRHIRERHLHLPVIFVTGHGDARNAVCAMKNGAVDFLEKPVSRQSLLEAVRHALQRNAEARRIVEQRAHVTHRYAELSPREQEVFALVVSDRPNKEIARQLKISPRTVEHHREHLMLKMHANSFAELITMAMLCGVHQLRLPD